MVSCSDDGSINIYDVSSFTKGGVDEYYLRTDIDNTYVPHHRTKPMVNKEDELFSELKQVAVVADEEMVNDKISRRTRKRKIG